jgi:hypothetical protein
MNIKTIIIVFIMILLMVNCQQHKDSDLEKAVELYYSDKGIHSIQIDFILVSQEIPNRAYVSATIMHNFVDRSGNFQKEYIGHILHSNQATWELQKKTKYTIDEKIALTLITE